MNNGRAFKVLEVIEKVDFKKLKFRYFGICFELLSKVSSVLMNIPKKNYYEVS